MSHADNIDRVFQTTMSSFHAVYLAGQFRPRPHLSSNQQHRPLRAWNTCYHTTGARTEKVSILSLCYLLSSLIRQFYNELKCFFYRHKNVKVKVCFLYLAQYPVCWATQSALLVQYTFLPWHTCSFRHQLGFSWMHSSHAAITRNG